MTPRTSPIPSRNRKFLNEQPSAGSCSSSALALPAAERVRSRIFKVGSRHSLQTAGSRSLQSLHSSQNSAELTTKERALLRLMIKSHGQVETDSTEAQRLERHLSTCLEESSTFKTMLFHDDKFAVKVMTGARELLEQRLFPQLAQIPNRTPNVCKSPCVIF